VLVVPPFLVEAGLRLRADFVTREQEAALLAEIDARPWDESVRRRTQHFGWRFDYQQKAAVACSEGLPPRIGEVAAALDTAALLPWPAQDESAAESHPLQVTVNEYAPGVGIAAHVDTHSAFADGLAALSLGGGIAFRLQRAADGRDVSLWLPPRSLLVLAGAARYEWRHGIASRRYDRVAGEWAPRSRRVSVTLRRVLRGGGCRCAWPAQCDAQAGGEPLELPTRIGRAGGGQADRLVDAADACRRGDGLSRRPPRHGVPPPNGEETGAAS
jgi:alkylated DNA repair protein alkB family protein 8